MALQVQSYDQLLGVMINKVLAIAGITDLHKGSAILTLLEAAAQNDASQMASLVQLLDDAAVDTATGSDLDALAFQSGLLDGRLPASFGSVYVTISDSTMTKVTTNVYVGTNPPIAGSQTINVNSTTGFAIGNSIYVGRGTSNYEGPFVLSGVTPGTAFGVLTLSAPLANNHAPNEVVTLAQKGNRAIPVGTQVAIPATNVAPQVTFTTQASATIADGEQFVTNVLVKASLPGSTGNAPLGAISQFTTSPFTGATVTNPAANTNATDAETDDQLRDRIKTSIQGLANGVAAAILGAITGLFDPDDNKRVVSAQLIQAVTSGQIGQLYVDDGTGFEPSFTGQGLETVINPAAGTEQYFQLGNYPLTRPQVVSTLAQPFNMSVGGTLTVLVDGVQATINLTPSSFAIPSNGTAIEVAEAINAASTLVNARTRNGQQNVVLFPASVSAEAIQVITGGINSVFGFPTTESRSLKLYKDDQLLAKNGVTASASSGAATSWSGFTDPSTLTVAINGKPSVWIQVGSSSISVSFNGVSYVTLANVTTFSSLGVTVSTALPNQWVTILNQAVSGASFSVNGNQLVLTSDISNSPSSSVQVIAAANGGGNLATIQGWDTTLHTGKNSDYALNRFSGQIQLTNPLVAGDTITAGSINTRGKVTSAANIGGFFNTSAGASSRLANIYVTVDGSATVRSVPVRPGITSLLTSNVTGNVWQFTDTASSAPTDKVFKNLLLGDYVAVSRHSGPAVTTTIAAGSNGASLPQATINVASTAGFPSSGIVYIGSSNGIQAVTYGGTSGGNQFTTCSGGSGTLTTGNAVSSGTNEGLFRVVNLDNTAQVSTTIAAGSNGASLPQATINVASTTGFPASGTIDVTTGAGVQTVTYTGTSGGNQFTGCAGGTGSMSTGGAVVSVPSSWFQVENVYGVAGSFTIAEAIDTLAFSSTVVPQKVSFANSTTTTPVSAVSQINSVITGATASVDSTGTKVLITANRWAVGGSVQVPASIEWAPSALLAFPNTLASSIAPHEAAIESASELGFPVAAGKGSVTTFDNTNPLNVIDSARSSGTITPDSVSTPNQWYRFYDFSGATHLPGNSKTVRMFTFSQSHSTPTVVGVRDNLYTALGLPRVVAPERVNPFFVPGYLYQQFYPYDFDQVDNLVVVIDGDTLNKTFNVPLYRNGQCTSVAASAITTANDLDAPTSSTFTSNTWNAYDFSDYKVWLRAHHTIDPTGSKNAITYRGLKFGPTGNNIRIAYDYPTAASQSTATSVGHTSTASTVTTDILVTLGSGTARTGQWVATTTFHVTVSGNSVTYTWGNTGGSDTSPNFVSSGVLVGDIATWNVSTSGWQTAANGTYVVTTVSATAITVTNNKTAPVTNATNYALGAVSVLTIYPLAGNTATSVVSAMNSGTISSLLVEAVLTTSDPFGTVNDGSGTITLSTLDDTLIASLYNSLVDGENWVQTFASPGPPSFTLKANWAERQVIDGGGAIYDAGISPNKDGSLGEYFKLIPVHAKNVLDHFNTPAFSALTQAATVQRSIKAQAIQIASMNVGSAGSVFVTGGAANGVTSAITKVAGTEAATWTRVSLPTSIAYGFHGNQVIQLSNAVGAKEVNTFASDTVVTTAIPGGTNPYERVTLSDRASFASGGTTWSVTANANGTATYTITAGSANPSSAITGDEAVITSTTGTPFSAANQGTFLVVSSSGSGIGATLIVINPEAVNESGKTTNNGDMKAVVPFFYHPNLKADGTQPIIVERLSERYARYRYLGGGTKDCKFATRGVLPGFWLNVASGTSATFQAPNVGKFRVVAVDDTSVIVENPNAVDDGPVNLVADPIGSSSFLGEIQLVVSGAGGLMQFWGSNSAMFGDSLVIANLTLPTWFPASWQGTFEITGHGRDSVTGDHFVWIVNSSSVTTSVTLGTNTASFFALESTPYLTYRIIQNVTLNPSDATETWVWFSGVNDADRFAAVNGTQLIAQNKLSYPTTAQVGVDGYQYWTGLLQRVHRVMDGFDQDTVNFPGVKAVGTQIEALPPKIRRVAISVSITPVQGLTTTSISDNIKGAILAYISSLGVGDDVVMSEIIRRVQEVSGVESITLVNPTPGTALIVINNDEKAIAFVSDITVT